jgi:hypothetical protein
MLVVRERKYIPSVPATFERKEKLRRKGITVTDHHIVTCHNMVASKTPLYEASTQFKNWRYSSQSLAKVRSSLNAAAVAVIRNTFEADEVVFNPRNGMFSQWTSQDLPQPSHS